MFNRRLTTLALLCLVLFCSSPVRAGPWVPDPYHGYIKAWTRWLLGEGWSDGNGDRVDAPAYHEVMFNLYLEQGLPGRVALVVHWPVVALFMLEDPSRGKMTTHATTGDPALGVRWNFIYWRGLAAALHGSLRFPVAPSAPVQVQLSPAPPHAPFGQLQVGSGVFDGTLGASLGYGWSRFHVAAFLGYILRSGGFDHDLYWNGEFGVTFFERLGLLARLTGCHPLPVRIGDEQPRHTSLSGIGNGTSYVGLALEAGYRVYGPLTLGLTVEGGLFAVQRQSRGPVFSLFFATTY
jgi:hypothetical protein